MRILAVSQNYPRKSQPGSGIFVHRLTKALVALGHEVTVLQTPRVYPAFPIWTLRAEWRKLRARDRGDLDEVDGVQILHSRTTIRVPSRLFRDSALERSRASAIRAVRGCGRDFDLVVAFFLWKDGAIALPIARDLGLPLVAVALGDDVHLWPERSRHVADCVREVVEAADVVIGNCKCIADDVLRWGSPKQPPEIVYLGIDPDRFRPQSDREATRVRLGLATTDRLVAFLGAPEQKKGFHELLHAVARLDGRCGSVRILKLGRSREDRWKAIARDLGVADRIVVRQDLSEQEIVAHLGVADLFCLPSHNEGLTTAAMEAMACAVPVVVSRVGGLPEIVRDGIDGILVAPKDAKALADTLGGLLADPDGTRAMGEAARKRILEGFTEAHGVSAFERVLAGAVG